jgi:hypothetical protein
MVAVDSGRGCRGDGSTGIRELFCANGFIRADIDAFLAACALILVHNCYSLIIQGDGLDGTLLSASSAAHAFFVVNNCGHQLGYGEGGACYEAENSQDSKESSVNHFTISPVERHL